MADDNLGTKWTLDVSDLKAGITEANRLVKIADTQFKATAASMGDWANNADGLSERIKALTTIVGIQEQTVAGLTDKYKKVSEEKGKSSRDAQELELQLAKETTALNKNKFELDTTEKALKDFGNSSEDTKKKQEDLRKKTEEVSASVNDFAKKSLVAVTAAAAAAGAALYKMFTDAGKFGDDLITMSNKTGISTERLQEMSYAARFVDVSVETMTGSMNKMTKTMDSARDAMSAGKINEQSAAYAELGVVITTTDGTLRNNKDVFYETIDALGKKTNATERDQLAMKIFGKSAEELNPLIKAGSVELNRLAKEAHTVGAVVSDEGVASLGEFDDNMETLKATSQGLTNEALAQLTPVINDLVTSLKENMPQIIEGIKSFITFTIDNGPTIIAVIGGIAAGLLAWNIISMITSVVEGIQAFQKANEGATVAQWALNAAQSANPIGIVIGLIVALVAGLMILWNTNEGFRDAVKKIFGDIVKTISGAVDSIVNFFTVTIPATLNNVGDWFGDIGENIVKGVWAGISGMGNWINDKVGGFFGNVVNGVKNFLGIKSPSTVFAGIGQYMAQGLGVGFADEIQNVNNDIQNAIRLPNGTSAYAGNKASSAPSTEGAGGITFVQNNYSPKALNAYEVYRQTKNAGKVMALSLNKG